MNMDNSGISLDFRRKRLVKSYPDYSAEQIESMLVGFDNKPTRMQLDLTDLNAMADLTMPVDPQFGVRRNVLDVLVDPNTDASIKKMIEESLQAIPQQDASKLSDQELLNLLPSRYLAPGQSDMYLNYIHSYLDEMAKQDQLAEMAKQDQLAKMAKQDQLVAQQDPKPSE